MMMRGTFGASLAVLMVSFGLAVPAPAESACAATQSACGASSQPVSPLLQCTNLMLRSADHAEGLLPQMTIAADAVAKRWIAGADIFVGGSSSFTEEAFYRAGGLIGMRRIAPFKQKFNGTTMPWSDVPEESIVLYGLHRNVDPAVILFDELGHLAFEKDTVVFFGSKDWPISQKIVKFLEKRLPAGKFFFIDTDLPVDTRLKTAAGDRLRRLCRDGDRRTHVDVHRRISVGLHPAGQDARDLAERRDPALRGLGEKVRNDQVPR